MFFATFQHLFVVSSKKHPLDKIYSPNNHSISLMTAAQIAKNDASTYNCNSLQP